MTVQYPMTIHTDEVAAAHTGPVTTCALLLRPDGRVLCAGSSLGRKRFQQALEFHPVVRHVSWEPFSVLHEWAAAYRARQAVDTLLMCSSCQRGDHEDCDGYDDPRGTPSTCSCWANGCPEVTP